MAALQAFKFIMVGLLNTVVGYSFYALFIYMGMVYVHALALATIIGVIFNFQTIGRIVFKSKDNTLIFKFSLVYMVTFCTNLLLIYVAKQNGANEYTGGALALFFTAVMSFLLNKHLVFKR